MIKALERDRCGVCPQCSGLADGLCPREMTQMQARQLCTCWTHAGCKSCEAAQAKADKDKRYLQDRDLVDLAFRAAVEEDGFVTVHPEVKK